MDSSLFDLLNNPDGIDENNFDSVFDRLSDTDRKKAMLEVCRMYNRLFFKNKKIIQEHFGASSEGLLTLFNYQDIDQILQDLEETDKALKEDEKAEQELKTFSRKAHNKKRTDMLENLPVSETDLYPDDPEFEKVRDLCSEVKPTIRQEIIREPQRYYNKKTICHNYVYTDEQGETHFFHAKDPVSKLIEGSYASPSLVAGILYDKCALDIPFYRQEKDLMRNGIDISRQTLCGWAMTVAEQYLEPLTDRMKKDLSSLSHLMIDETVLQVIQNHKKGGNKLGTIIAARSGHFEEKQMAYYLFSEKKDKAAFQNLLPLDYAGHISCDAASTHYQFSKATILGCNAHARRKILDAIKTRVDYQQYVKLSASEQEAWLDEKGNTALGLALRILMRYKKLYQIEYTARKLKETPDQILARRKAESVPVFEQLIQLNELLVKGTRPKTELNSAAKYIKSHQEHLGNYLNDGEAEIDDNAIERTIKAFVLSRKNFLFSNTNRGARDTAICFTMVQSAILNRLKPERYLSYVLDTLRREGLRDEVIERLLPYSKKLPEELYLKPEEEPEGVYRES